VKRACLATLALVALVALLVWLVPRPTTTTTVAPLVAGTCVFWGDPHVLTFDGARPSFYGEGEFWVVKGDSIKVQGRFLGTAYTRGLSATNKLAVGGDFVNGHVIEVGTMEGGHPTVDGVEVLTTLGSTYSLEGGLGTLTYNAEGDLPDEAASHFDRNIVHMDLPNGVRIEIFRWMNYLDFRIHVPLGTKVDGCCGNYNGWPADDTTAKIFSRIGARVPEGELIFSQRAAVVVSQEMQRMIAAACPEARLQPAKDNCRSALPLGASGESMDACVYDYCFGAVEHALKIAEEYR